MFGNSTTKRVQTTKLQAFFVAKVKKLGTTQATQTVGNYQTTSIFSGISRHKNGENLAICWLATKGTKTLQMTEQKG